MQQLQWLYEQGRDPHFLETALRFFGFERRLPFTLTATASPPLPPGARAPDNNGRCWAAPAGATVTLVATLAEPALVDEIGLIACGGRTAPAHVTAVTEAGSVPLSRPGRFSVIRLPARVLASVRFELVPAEGSHVAISLVSLSSPALRSLTALSSDIGAYWDRARSPLNVSDGRAETSWSTARDDPWLLVGLGEAGSAQLALEPCRDRPRALEWAFSPDLERWTRPLPVESARGTRLPVPDGARFLLLRWSGKGGCLADIRGLA